MPNLDFPRGAEPIRMRDGGSIVSDIIEIASTNTLIGYFDLLERRADGFIWPAQAASTTIVGIAMETIQANTGGTINYVPLNADVLFTMQSDDASIDAQTDFDLVYDIIASAPNALTGRSTMEIDGSSGAATATLPIKILRVHPIITQDGNALGANVLLECVINHGVTKGAGTVG